MAGRKQNVYPAYQYLCILSLGKEFHMYPPNPNPNPNPNPKGRGVHMAIVMSRLSNPRLEVSCMNQYMLG